MYKIKIEDRLNDGTWECSTYTEKFFKEKKEAILGAFNVAAAECNKINSHSDLQYKLRITAGIASPVAIISAQGVFATPVKRYYVEQIDDTEAIKIFFDSISDIINDYSLVFFDTEYCLFNFETDIINLMRPYLYNSRAFDIVNMVSEPKYWINEYRDRYDSNALIKELFQSIVFKLLCIIDGTSSENDFKIEKMAFDKTLQGTKLHQLWCAYLNERTNKTTGEN